MYSTPEINTNQRHNPTTKMKHNNQYNHLPKIKLFNHSNLSTTLLLCETHYSCSICSSPTLFTNQLTATPPAHVCMIVCLYLCQLLIVFVSTFNCICQPDCIESFSIFNFSFMKKFHDFFLTRAIFIVVLMLVKIGAGS